MNKDIVNIIIGDSIAYGLRDNEHFGWVNRIRFKDDNMLKSFYFNLSIPGQSSCEIVKRFEKEFMSRYNLDDTFNVIFAFGIKDALLLDKQKNQINIFKKNVSKLINISKKYTNNIYFLGLLDVDIAKRNTYNKLNIQTIDELLCNTCNEHYIKYISMKNIIELTDLTDGLHPNEIGHEKIANYIYKTIFNKDYLKPLEFNEDLIDSYKAKINSELVKYIEDNIIPEYELNDEGHNSIHINYVLNRALEISKDYNLNLDILYACIMFHDIACHIDRETHEILSAKRAYQDEFLNTFFNKEQMLIIKDAIEDHRASLEYEPRNIYGKILSSADRKVEVKVYLISSMAFIIKKNPNITKEEVVNDSYNFAVKKFGKEGYAVHKTYVNDNKYKEFLNDLQDLIENKELYFKYAGIVYDELKGNE